jgi:glycosyltransferase involved in cell wall biosynthesis
MYDISLILPTRGRPQHIERVLDSLMESAVDPSRLEIVLYVDLDDEPSHGIEFAGANIVKLIRPRTKMGRITRQCYEASHGRYIMLANDDMIFQTREWDRIVVDAFAQCGDDIALVWGNDLHSGMPVHPYLSRAVCDLMDGVCPEDYDREFIDTHIWDIFRKLKRLGHDRMRYLPDLVLEHIYVHAGKAEADATFEKPRHAADERLYIAWDEERQCKADQIGRHIGKS